MNIALVAHDNRKEDLIAWVSHNADIIYKHSLICTGTTGKLVAKSLIDNDKMDFSIKRLKSGPLGGDQELGAMIANDKIDILVFFWDPMSAQPHDPDVKALLRLAVLYNIPTANNKSTADFIITSELFNGDYDRVVKDYTTYINRTV